jgi:hypothetical protein
MPPDAPRIGAAKNGAMDARLRLPERVTMQIA